MRVQSLTLPNEYELPTGALNVFIGPNNAGKTQILKDIQGCSISQISTPVVLRAVQFEPISDVQQLLHGTTLGERKYTGQKTDWVRGLGSNLTSGHEVEFHIDNYRKLENPMSVYDVGHEIRMLQVAFLNAELRLQLTKQSPAHNPQIEAPSNLLQAFFVDEGQASQSLNEIFHEIFGTQIRLDYSSLKDLCIRVGDDVNEITDNPRLAYKELRRRRLLDSEGEGMRSLVAIVLSVLLCKKKLLLIDEPEAFLHPAHARKLGAWVAREALESGGQIFLSTHSASFLAGLVSKESDVNVVRIARNKVGNHVSVISPQSLKGISLSSVLSSQRVVDSLFHKGVVLCEADSDRLIYQTVSEKSSGRADFQFVYAHNKQMLAPVARLLRDTHVPVVAIADIDLLNSEVDLMALVNALSPSTNTEELKTIRNSLAGSLTGLTDPELLDQLKLEVEKFSSELGKNEHTISGAHSALNRLLKRGRRWQTIKQQGVDGFDTAHQPLCKKLIEQLQHIGLFIVPVGELENWIPSTVNKKHWVPFALSEISKGVPEGLDLFISQVVNYLEQQTFTTELSTGLTHPDLRKCTMKSTKQIPGMYYDAPGSHWT